MGQFYGTNILFAESSATTGGLDSLLEPTGNIKKTQEAHRARLRRQARVPRHQRHLDLEQDRRAGGLQARRHRHRRPQLPQVAPLRLRAERRAALLRRGVPADPVLDVRRGAAAHDQEGAARLHGRGQARPGQGHRHDQLHLRRAHVQPAAGDGGVPGDQARPDLPVGRGVVRLRALQPVPPPPHRDGRGRGADRALPQQGLPRRVRGLGQEASASSIRSDTERCSTRACCPIRTRCGSASTRPTRPTSRCRRSARAR